MDGRGERHRARQVVASRHHHAPKQNTALISFSFRKKKKHIVWEERVQFRRDFDPMSSSFLFLFSDTHTRSQMKHTLSHTIPNAYKLGGVLISLTHEASFLGHQLTEAGLGRDGAQEVSHCPAAEPAAWVLQSPSLPPSFPISNPHPSSFPPIPLFPSLLKNAFPLASCVSFSSTSTQQMHCSSLRFFHHWSL